MLKYLYFCCQITLDLRPAISVIIPTKNNSHYVGGCLDSLVNQDFDKSFEVIIVDESDDNTLEIVKNFESKLGLKFIRTSNSTPGSARNEAIKRAKAEILAFIDSDALASKNWLRKGYNLVKSFSKKNKLALVGGPDTGVPNDGFVPDCINAVLSSYFGSGPINSKFKSSGNLRKVGVDSLIACNLFALKSSLVDVGLFDDYLVPAEETDIVINLEKKGYVNFYSPDLRVSHHKRQNLKDFAKQIFHYGRTRIKLMKKHKSGFSFLSFGPTFFVLSTPLLYPLLIYFLVSSIESMRIAISKKRLIFLSLPFYFFVLHFSYGIGFIYGLMSR